MGRNTISDIATQGINGVDWQGSASSQKTWVTRRASTCCASTCWSVAFGVSQNMLSN